MNTLDKWVDEENMSESDEAAWNATKKGLEGFFSASTPEEVANSDGIDSLVNITGDTTHVILDSIEAAIIQSIEMNQNGTAPEIVLPGINAPLLGIDGQPLPGIGDPVPLPGINQPLDQPLPGVIPLPTLQPLPGIEPLQLAPLPGTEPIQKTEPLPGIAPLPGVEPLPGVDQAELDRINSIFEEGLKNMGHVRRGSRASHNRRRKHNGMG